ncbi:hypothetical protein C8J57DRAFT_1601732 [Mycena rebaudengoi]|nr:hypothetical protein C8J57DRAFT_1601732 [Mycena rebaudengoi]
MSDSSSTTSPPVAPITYHGAYSVIVSSQLIGSLLNFFLFGLLTAQTHTNSASPRTDTALNSSAIYFVFVSMLVCTCLNAADVHYWFAAGFGDISRFEDPRFGRFYTPLWGSVIALIVQCYFCYRIAVLVNKRLWPWVAVIALVSCAQCAGGMGAGILSYIHANRIVDRPRDILVDMWLIGGAAADVMIAVAMTLVLLRMVTLPATRDLVKGIVLLILETNTFSAITAVIGLTLFKTIPNTTYYICPTMMLPGMYNPLKFKFPLPNRRDVFPSYANTLLATLNNRAVAKLVPSASVLAVSTGSALHFTTNSVSKPSVSRPSQNPEESYITPEFKYSP